MKLFTFIIKKAMKPTVILTAGLLCAALMTDDYTEVLHNEESSDTVYDTRAADNALG